MISLFLRSQYVAVVSCQFDRRYFRSRVHSIEIKGQFIEKSNCLTKPSAFPSLFQIFPFSFFADKFHCVVYKHHLTVPKIYHCNI